MRMKDFKRKLNYAVFIPKKVTRRPSDCGSVISDLFPVRNDARWQTFFELLNIPALLNGSFSIDASHEIIFVFFDRNGAELGRKIVPAPIDARHTLELNNYFFPEIKNAATFSVFHSGYFLEDDLVESFLAERGYAGYQRSDLSIRGYVHGNLDSIAFHEGKLELLGNAGLFRRSYQVQHPLTGEADYEFILTNPTNSKVKIRVQLKTTESSWKKVQTFTLNPRGSKVFSIKVGESDRKLVRIVSRLYLGRPVVFRNTQHSMDVFHG